MKFVGDLIQLSSFDFASNDHKMPSVDVELIV